VGGHKSFVIRFAFLTHWQTDGRQSSIWWWGWGVNHHWLGWPSQWWQTILVWLVDSSNKLERYYTFICITYYLGNKITQNLWNPPHCGSLQRFPLAGGESLLPLPREPCPHSQPAGTTPHCLVKWHLSTAQSKLCTHVTQ